MPNKPKTRKPRAKKAADKPEPGARYWRVFGQVHIVKLANADRVRSIRKATKLVEYIETKTLDHAQEISDALKGKLKHSPYIERVEIWSVSEVTRRAFNDWNKPRLTSKVWQNKLTQAELFAAEVMAAMQVPANEAGAPAAPDEPSAVSGQPENKTPGIGSNARERASEPSEIHRIQDQDGKEVRVYVAPGKVSLPCAVEGCDREGVHLAENGKAYCPVCWPMYPDKQAPAQLIQRDDLPGSRIAGCGGSDPLDPA